MIGVFERHKDVGIVVAGCGISTFGTSEHPPEGSPRSHRCDARPVVVDHTVLGEEADNLVVQPVIDGIRIAMNEVDYLVLVNELTHRSGYIALHQSPLWFASAFARLADDAPTTWSMLAPSS